MSQKSTDRKPVCLRMYRQGVKPSKMDPANPLSLHAARAGTDRPLDPLLRQNQIVGGPSNQATTPQPVNVAWSDPRRHSDDGPSSVGGGGEAATRFAASRRASAALSRSRVVGLRHRPMQDRDFRNLSTTRSTGSAGGGRLPPPTATSRLSRRR